MNLVVDIGNTNAKAAVFNGPVIVERWHGIDLGATELSSVFKKYPGIKNCILATTRDGVSDAELFLSASDRCLLRFDGATPTPLKNMYETPHTLGADRLAAAVGAYTACPSGRDILICDFGTAITVDFVSAEGEYLGGSISPGATARFRALRDYTGRLPLLGPEEETAKRLLGGNDGLYIAKNTADAIAAGVMQGIMYEIEGYIARVRKKNGDAVIFFTGGEGKYFADKFKNTIFVDYDLVLAGLNRISEYNAENYK